MIRSLLRGLAFPALLMSLQPALAQSDRDGSKRQPVKSMQASYDDMFGLPPGDTAYFFRVNLRDDNFMTMRFEKLSSWEPGALKDVFALAKLGWDQVQDSLHGTATARRIALSVPESNYPVLTAYREYSTEDRVLMLGNEAPRPVRIAYDTLCVLRRYRRSSEDTSQHRRVLYTFLLKDLAEINDLAADTALIESIGRSFDSVVENRRRRWKFQDAPVHGIGLEYDPAAGLKAPQLRRWYESRWYKYFDYNVELGTSFLAGQIGSYSSFKLAYNFRETRPGSNGYIALSASGLGFYQVIDRQLEIQSTAYVNFEMGAVLNGTFSGLPVYRTAVGFGYRVREMNSRPYNFRYRVFFSYGVTKSISIMPDFYLMGKKDRLRDDEGFSVGGITVSVRLF